MPILAPFARLAVAGSLLLALAACDGVGDGSRPERVEIIRTSGLIDATKNISYRCFPDSLQAIVWWTNGSAGNYSSGQGMKWTSDNPSIAKVSDGTLALPDDPTLVYTAGTIVPIGVGTTTIRAVFLDALVASYEVEVKAPTALTLTPQSQVLALATSGGVTLKATVEGEEIDVTQKVLWKLEEEDADDLATIGGGSGVVLAKKAAGVVTAVPQFGEGCPSSLTAGLKGTVNIRQLASISIAREFTSAPNNELMLNTNELFTATGHFAGTTETQDLGALIPFKSSDNEVVFAASRLVTGVKVGTANITGVYTLKVNDTPADDVVVTSNAVPLTVIDRPLASIAVTPATATIEAGKTQQYAAVGSFSDGVTTTAQDITRNVVWSTSDTAAAVIGNGQQIASGLAVAVKNETTTTPIVITAKKTIGTGDTAVEKTGTAQLSITAIPEATP